MIKLVGLLALLVSGQSLAIAETTYQPSYTLHFIGKCLPNMRGPDGTWDCKLKHPSERKFVQCTEDQSALLEKIKVLKSNPNPTEDLPQVIKQEFTSSGVIEATKQLECAGFSLNLISRFNVPNIGPSSANKTISFSAPLGGHSPLTDEIVQWRDVAKQRECSLRVFCSKPRELNIDIEFAPTGTVSSVKSSFYYPSS